VQAVYINSGQVRDSRANSIAHQNTSTVSPCDLGITGEAWNEPGYHPCMPDAPTRPAAPLDESAYTVSIEDAADRYAVAGFPRPIRRLQKYCARGDLECRKVETASGEKYLITPESIERHIAYIKETARTAQPRPDAPSRAPARLGAAADVTEESDKSASKEDASGRARFSRPLS